MRGLIANVVGIAVGVAIGTLAFWLIMSSVAHKPLLELIGQSHSLFLNEPLNLEKMPKADVEALDRLVKRGKVTTLDNLVGTVISFFSTIITVLLGFLALVGALAFIYVRHASYAHAEEAAKGFIEEKFNNHLGRKEYHDQLDQTLETLVGPKLNEINATQTEIDEAMESLGNLEERINNKLEAFGREIAEKKAELDQIVAVVSGFLARFDRQEEAGEDFEIGPEE